MKRQHDGNPLGSARHEFFQLGQAPVGQVPNTILASWKRCQSQGLDADNPLAIEPVPQSVLREIRERNEKLWRLARAELEALASESATTGTIVVLTDDEGWILDAEGAPQFLDKAGRVALRPGACWNEAAVGTNAVGTAIVERRPVEVRGAEHYLSPHKILSCSASPILDPFGRLVGVLDISGDSRVSHVHALGLARLAVANIEHRYFDEGIPGCELVRVHHDPALLGTAREGLLAFDGHRLVAANRAGLQLFGLDHGDMGRVRYDALFDDRVERLRQDGALFDRHGRALFGRVDSGDDRRPRRPSKQPPVRVSEASPPGADGPLFDNAMEHALTAAGRVLDADLPVLVQGETGTGKEVFARELHRRGARSGKPFVAVNCAALPEGLIEAELFGYEEGAFTGARRQGNPGLFRQAEGGVLFLDEIGDMPLSLQPRLLRVLQERELSPLGGGKPVKLDFALVCATHRDLDEAVNEGRFRADLYYRIAHHQVRIKPLRDNDDRIALVEALWSRVAQGRTLDDAATQALASYEWPGNLRQLSACLRTLVALSDIGETLGVAHLPAYIQGVRAAAAQQRGTRVEVGGAAGLDAITEAAMRDALDQCGGNVVRAARKLGVSRSTLYRRLGNALRPT